jgi:hypothetical protein
MYYSFFKSSIVVYLKFGNLEIPLSIQQLYELYFGKPLSSKNAHYVETLKFRINLNEYRLYSNLNFNGFIIRRKQHKNEPVQVTSLKKSIEIEKRSENNNTVPLINRDTLLNKNEIFDKLNSIVPNITFESLKEKIETKVGYNLFKSNRELYQIFDAYAPNKSFKKSNPEATCKEKLRIFTQNSENKSSLYFPKLSDFILAANDSVSSVGQKNIISFVTSGNTTYYSFDLNFQMPDINND